MDMERDEIVDEVRAAREQYAARFNFDLEAICRDLREKQKAGTRRVVSLPGRKPQKHGRKTAA